MSLENFKKAVEVIGDLKTAAFFIVSSEDIHDLIRREPDLLDAIEQIENFIYELL